MTIKELVPHYHKTMDKFVNPENKPLEELKIKFISSNSCSEEFIPALDQKWCNMDYVFTLYLPPPFKDINSEFTMGSKEDWLERMSLFIGDMNVLLQLDYHRFWSEVMYNRRSLDGVSSFLQNAPPIYLRDQIPQYKDILQKFKKAQESVFLVLMRLTRTKETEKSWMENVTLGSILYNNFVISLPQLIEICLIYANDNLKEVTELIDRVIQIQPNYMNDIGKSTPFICEVLSSFENQLGSVCEDNGEPSPIACSRRPITPVEIIKLIHLMLDIGYSLANFLEVCPRAATVFHDHQLEPRIASFYGNTIPVLVQHLDSHLNTEKTHEQYKKYKFQINLSRHQLIVAVHSCLTTCLSTLLEDRDYLTEQEMKNRVDNYLNTLCECLSDHVFIRDYNSAFPIQRELNILSEICPDMDTLKCEFIIESVMSLYEVNPKQQQIAKPLTEPKEAVLAISTSVDHISQGCSKVYLSRNVSGVELESLITEVKDILPHLGDGFIVKCLDHYSFVSSDVINAILESTLPDHLASLDRDMPMIPCEDTEGSKGLPERINIYDNDEFDIMTKDKVDTSRIHRGKRQEKHKSMFEMLDDKTHVNHLRDVYTKLSLVEYVENANDYEDEYDDTYDDLDVPVTNEGETEKEERREFVIPRVLQQHKKPVEDFPEYGDEEEDDDDENGVKNDLFIENPADIRERSEQRRQEMRGRNSGRSRAAFNHRDVVGKPKGQGQEKEVFISREFKNASKATRGNHNRRSMAAKKRRQGLLPT